MLTAQEFAKKYELDLQKTEIAFSKISSGERIVLGISGKIGAGKDSVAPAVLKNLDRFNAEQEYFAKPLKEEVSEAITHIKFSISSIDAAFEISQEQNVPYEQAYQIVNTLRKDVKKKKVTDGYTRTSSTRFALQFWGTEIRRNQDPNYWVKKTMASVIDFLSEDKDVYVTDARFENEVIALTDLGATTVRLKVSPEIQRKRILERDGILPSDEALNHISETALDSFEKDGKFSIIVDTDENTLNEVIEYVMREFTK